jgi:hypothetical protein
MFGICKEGHRVCLGILEETNERGVGLVKYCWVVVSFLLSAYAIIAEAFLGKSLSSNGSWGNCSLCC